MAAALPPPGRTAGQQHQPVSRAAGARAACQYEMTGSQMMQDSRLSPPCGRWRFGTATSPQIRGYHPQPTLGTAGRNGSHPAGGPATLLGLGVSGSARAFQHE
jgi:hypothetical protein